MNNLPRILLTIILVIVIIHEIVKIQPIGSHDIDPFVQDHLQFHNHMIITALDIVIAMKKTVQTELLHVEKTMNFAKKRFYISLSLCLRRQSLPFFLEIDTALRIGSDVETAILLIDFFQVLNQEPLLPHKVLSLFFNQFPLNSLIRLLNLFQRQKTKMKPL